jgi:hypothetical protein
VVHILRSVVNSPDVLFLVFTSRHVRDYKLRRFSPLEMLLVAVDKDYQHNPNNCTLTQVALLARLHTFFPLPHCVVENDGDPDVNGTFRSHFLSCCITQALHMNSTLVIVFMCPLSTFRYVRSSQGLLLRPRHRRPSPEDARPGPARERPPE